MIDIDTSDRGQIGVNAVIVFIAVILIASISAGVLINTTTSLESQSAKTGEDTNRQVTVRAQVVGVAGNVTTQGTVDWVNITVKPAAGSGNLDLTDLTVQYIGPNGAETMVHTTGSPADGEFVVDSLGDADGSVPVLNDREDRASIAIDLRQPNVDLAPLDAHERATIRLMASSGSTTRVRIGPPGELSDETSVAL